MKRCRKHIRVGATCIPPPLFNINPYASRQFINLTDIPVECVCYGTLKHHQELTYPAILKLKAITECQFPYRGCHLCVFSPVNNLFIPEPYNQESSSINHTHRINAHDIKKSLTLHYKSHITLLQKLLRSKKTVDVQGKDSLNQA